MASKSRTANIDVPGQPWPFCGPSCQCLANFFREEFVKHHQCLERQREFYSDVAISQAEDALTRILSRVEQLSQRDDAGEVIGQLLRQLDLVTNLSALTEPETLN
jgi:hypothetical protein